MPRWKPKTPYEKFQNELSRLERKISAKKIELADMEKLRHQLEAALSALVGNKPTES